MADTPAPVDIPNTLSEAKQLIVDGWEKNEFRSVAEIRLARALEKLIEVVELQQAERRAQLRKSNTTDDGRTLRDWRKDEIVRARSISEALRTGRLLPACPHCSNNVPVCKDPHCPLSNYPDGKAPHHHTSDAQADKCSNWEFK